MDWATFWAIFSQTHQVTLSKVTPEMKENVGIVMLLFITGDPFLADVWGRVARLSDF
jgi:hypothetical protein